MNEQLVTFERNEAIVIRGGTPCWFCVTYGGASLGSCFNYLSRKLQLSAFVGCLSDKLASA